MHRCDNDVRLEGQVARADVQQTGAPGGWYADHARGHVAAGVFSQPTRKKLHKEPCRTKAECKKRLQEDAGEERSTGAEHKPGILSRLACKVKGGCKQAVEVELDDEARNPLVYTDIYEVKGVKDGSVYHDKVRPGLRNATPAVSSLKRRAGDRISQLRERT